MNIGKNIFDKSVKESNEKTKNITDQLERTYSDLFQRIRKMKSDVCAPGGSVDREQLDTINNTIDEISRSEKNYKVFLGIIGDILHRRYLDQAQETGRYQITEDDLMNGCDASVDVSPPPLHLGVRSILLPQDNQLINDMVGMFSSTPPFLQYFSDIYHLKRKACSGNLLPNELDSINNYIMVTIPSISYTGIYDGYYSLTFSDMPHEDGYEYLTEQERHEIIKKVHLVLIARAITGANIPYDIPDNQLKLRYTPADFIMNCPVPSPAPSPLPRAPSLTNEQIRELKPIVERIEYLLSLPGYSMSTPNVTLINDLDDFRNITGFNYYVGFVLNRPPSGGKRRKARKTKKSKKSRKARKSRK